MGAAVSQVTRGSAADKGGIVDGDIIINIDGNPILRSEDLPHIVGLITPGTSVDVEVYREGKKKTLRVEVGSLDADDDIRLAGNNSFDRLGLVVEEIGADQARENRIRSGLIVVNVDPNSPAEIAGLKVNDIIVQIGYQRIEDIRQYDAYVRQLRGQKPIALRFYRGGNAYFTTLEIN
jgi:serine protease Do